MSVLLTLKEAAESLNVSRNTICTWVKENKIDYIVLPNGRRRYKIENIVSSDIKKKTLNDMESSTLEYQQENKETTLNDRLNISGKNIPLTTSSETLEAELTTREMDLKPWWNEWCVETSKKLWLPTKTDCVALDLNSSSCSFPNTEQTSWFSITKNLPKKRKWYRISFPSLQSSLAGCMVLENTNRKSKKTLKHKKRNYKYKRKKKKVNGMHRNYVIRLYPTAEQRRELRKWFGTARYCYNQIISRYNHDISIPLNYDTRKLVLEEIPFTHKNVNLEVKKNAIKEAFDTISAGGDKFRFRSRKNNSESIYVRRNCISNKKNTIFPNTFGIISSRGGKVFKPELDGSRLVRKGNKYYLYIIKIKKLPNIVFKEGNRQNTICALDPGSYTFLDYYSNLDCGKIAPNAGPNIFRRCLRIDRLISKKSKLQSRRKYKINRALRREHQRLKNQINDLHWKTASFLCSRYDHIFLPHFETQSMVSKKGKKWRKISSKTARNMLTLSHFLFSQRLTTKAQEKGTTVYKLGEPYTSQLCGNCFSLNKGLKLTDRTYKCKRCCVKIDRDFNAARNILIRGLSLLKEQKRDLLRWEVPPFSR